MEIRLLVRPVFRIRGGRRCYQENLSYQFQWRAWIQRAELPILKASQVSALCLERRGIPLHDCARLACSHSCEIFSPASKRTQSSYSKPLNTSVAIKQSAEIYSPSRHHWRTDPASGIHCRSDSQVVDLLRRHLRIAIDLPPSRFAAIGTVQLCCTRRLGRPGSSVRLACATHRLRDPSHQSHVQRLTAGRAI